VRYKKKFEERGLHRAALINTGAAPGLTNLLVQRAPKCWMKSTPCTFACTKARKRRPDFPVVPGGLFRRSHFPPADLPRREIINWPSVFQSWRSFAFRIPSAANVVLAAQDEVATLPHYIPCRELDVKIGGNEFFDRLRRWHNSEILSKSRGLQRRHFQKHLPRARSLR